MKIKRSTRDDGNDSDESNPNSVSAITLQAKRMKLSKTPGELCLANDIHGLVDVPGVRSQSSSLSMKPSSSLSLLS